MAEASKIEWTDATWNPITGCSVISPGCTNCYAMRLAGTRMRHHPSRRGLTEPSKAGPVWTGEVRLNESWLDQPLRWGRSRMVFVCAHSDLFHEKVPREWIDKVFDVMERCQRHTFQVLTKRPGRMLDYWGDRDFGRHPLPNVWLGTSVERQQEADERVPHLLNTPAAVRFVSAEPLLGPIDIRAWINCGRGIAGLDWVICGGESGPGKRPMELAWARSLRDQCQSAGVAFYMKQIDKVQPIPDDLMVREFPG